MRAFGRVSRALGQDRIFIAGFTEVMSRAARANLTTLALSLDPILQRTQVFAVGVTAVGGKKEYVGISLANDFDLQISGKVLPLTPTKWRAYPTTELPAAEMPAGEYVADVRGLAYVGGRFGGQRMLVGFMHNVYTLSERAFHYRAIPHMVDAIWAAHRDWGETTVYLGGDFNVQPNDLDATYRVRYALTPTGDPINTTKNHPYDFWITNDPLIGRNRPQVFTQTRWDKARRRNLELSDHAGVSFRIM